MDTATETAIQLGGAAESRNAGGVGRRIGRGAGLPDRIDFRVQCPYLTLIRCSTRVLMEEQETSCVARAGTSWRRRRCRPDLTCIPRPAHWQLFSSPGPGW